MHQHAFAQLAGRASFNMPIIRGGIFLCLLFTLASLSACQGPVVTQSISTAPHALPPAQQYHLVMADYPKANVMRMAQEKVIANLATKNWNNSENSQYLLYVMLSVHPYQFNLSSLIEKEDGEEDEIIIPRPKDNCAIKCCAKKIHRLQIRMLDREGNMLFNAIANETHCHENIENNIDVLVTQALRDFGSDTPYDRKTHSAVRSRDK